MGNWAVDSKGILKSIASILQCSDGNSKQLRVLAELIASI
jgi:hypothetical protein